MVIERPDIAVHFTDDSEANQMRYIQLWEINQQLDNLEA